MAAKKPAPKKAIQVVKSEMYLWEGVDRHGKKVKGELSANNEGLVKAQLRTQAINPLKVKKKPKSLFAGGKGGKAITTKDIAVFSRQLATMMSSGVPLVQSFEIVGRGHENPNMQDLIMGIKGHVEAGGALADALAQYPKHFDELYVSLVHAGEHAGILESLLHKLANYMEKSEALKSKIKSALFYPLAVIVVAFIITAILLIFVIPQFEDLFKGFGANLPAPTVFVIQLSKVFVAYWYYGAAVIFGTITGLKTASARIPAVSHFFDRLILRIPVVGDIIHKATVARFARTLATMFAAGTPLVEAMSSVAGACGNIVYFNAVMKMRDDVATGTQLQVSMRETGVWPNMVVQMVAIGEEAGSLDAMLDKIADWYEAEVDDAVDALTSLLEPMIMAFLGVVIGGLVVAMYLPIFKMGEAV
jgi:type IV pilus assembly protein PilC